jgi:hypothetical protein
VGVHWPVAVEGPLGTRLAYSNEMSGARIPEETADRMSLTACTIGMSDEKTG